MDEQQLIQEEEKKYILSDRKELGEEKDAEDKNNQSSLPLASFNYINSIVGSGIIGMAYALNKAGVLLGFVLILFMGLVTDYSLIILIKSSKISGTHSYQGVMNAAFGFKGYVLLSVVQFIYPFIAMISYNVIVGDTITKVLVYYADLDESSPWARRELIISLSCLFFSLPLSLGKGMAKFAKFSLISLIITGFVLSTIIYRLFTLGPSVPFSNDAWVLAKPGITQAVAIASFAYMCHHSTFLLYGSLKQPSEDRWKRLTHFSVFVSALIEISFAMFGYATFTGLVQGDLLNNYCQSDDLMNVSRLLFCLTILLTSPIEAFVSRDIVINTLIERSNNEIRDHHPVEGMNLKRALVTSFLVCSTALISFSTDCLSIVLEFNGVLAAIPLAYILPAACYLRLEPRGIRHKLLALFMFLFGVIISLSGIFMIFYNWGENASCSHGEEMPYCANSTFSFHQRLSTNKNG